MSPKHFIIVPILILLLYLGMYSWNQRTGFLDNLAQSTGLEGVGAVLKSIRILQDPLTDAYDRYLDLVNVREENVQLKQRLSQFETRLILAAEERAELERLRGLLDLQAPEGWQQLGSRVLSGRMGTNAALITVTIDRGYLTGATPGAPAMTQKGLLGRVFRAGPTTATVLLLTDPGSRVHVVSQNGRVQGMLAGTGPFKPLDLRYGSHNTKIEPGELLVTSGLDEAFPKGLPVARVTSARPSDLSPFQQVEAEPLVNMSALEEILVLAPPLAAPATPAAPEPPKPEAPKPEVKPESRPAQGQTRGNTRAGQSRNAQHRQNAVRPQGTPQPTPASPARTTGTPRPAQTSPAQTSPAPGTGATGPLVTP